MKNRNNNEQLKDLHDLDNRLVDPAKMAKVASSEDWRQAFEEQSTGRSRNETVCKSGF